MRLRGRRFEKALLVNERQTHSIDSLDFGRRIDVRLLGPFLKRCSFLLAIPFSV